MSYISLSKQHRASEASSGFGRAKRGTKSGGSKGGGAPFSSSAPTPGGRRKELVYHNECMCKFSSSFDLYKLDISYLPLIVIFSQVLNGNIVLTIITAWKAPILLAKCVLSTKVSLGLLKKLIPLLIFQYKTTLKKLWKKIKVKKKLVLLKVIILPKLAKLIKEMLLNWLSIFNG